MGRATALLLGVVAALVLAELAVRLLGLDEFRFELVIPPALEATQRYDERLGWTNLPNVRSTNSQGFRFPRDYEFEESREPRLAILGDSQVFGWGVLDDRHVGVILDERVGLEAYPFGVLGYGPTQELLLLRDVLERYELSAVIVVAFLENDLVDATLSMAYGRLQKPYLQATPAGWRVTNVPVPMPIPRQGDRVQPERFYSKRRQEAFLRPHWSAYEASALYRTLVSRSVTRPWLLRALSGAQLTEVRLVSATASERWSVRRVDGREIPCWGVSNCPEKHWLDGLDPAVAAYLLMARLCRKRGVSFAVVVSPSLTELERGSFTIAGPLVSRLREAGVQVVDLTQAFVAAGDPARVIAPHRHWTNLGHLLAAREVARKLGSPNPGDEDR